MDSKIIKQNASLLWNRPDANYTVNNEGKIEIISKWNLVGRLIKYIKNRHGGVDAKVNKAVYDTLKTIRDTNASNTGNKFKMVYVRDRDFSLFFDASYAYSHEYPAYYLAERVKAAVQFKQSYSIGQITDQLIKQKDLYPNAESPKGKDTKILGWDEIVL